MGSPEDIAKIVLQEKSLHFQSLTESDAWKLGCLIRDEAAAKRLPVVIEIRRAGSPLFFTALPGSTPDNVEWARRKSNVVARFHRSSYALSIELEHRKHTLFERYALPLSDYAAHGGGFPICVAGAGVIGSVTVSGLPQRDDHEFVVEMLCAELEQDYAKLCLP